MSLFLRWRPLDRHFSIISGLILARSHERLGPSFSPPTEPFSAPGSVLESHQPFDRVALPFLFSAWYRVQGAAASWVLHTETNVIVQVKPHGAKDTTAADTGASHSPGDHATSSRPALADVSICPKRPAKPETKQSSSSIPAGPPVVMTRPCSTSLT